MEKEAESLEKRYQRHRELAPARVQNHYNKENLETQHKYDLEIFEKQAGLTREMQEKQRRLTIIAIIITAISTIGAGIIGAALSTYLQSKTIIEKTRTTSQPSAGTPIQKYQSPSSK